jgi:hypothetical protein
MKNVIPEGLQEIVGAALGKPELERSPQDQPTGTLLVVGDVLDTHHPTLAGRVLVRWLDDKVVPQEDWLEPERHLSLVKGDRVLVTRPAGWREWIVTGALGRRPAAAAPAAPATQTLRLGPGEGLLVEGHDGAPLVTLHQGPQGPRLEVSSDSLEISARQTLRLSAHTIELISSDGGLELRTDGDAVVRGRFIRLN